MAKAIQGLTGLNVRGINRRLVLSWLYTAGGGTKHQLVRELNMSLSTVDQNLKELENAGLIVQQGFTDSTGGRPARRYGVNPRYKCAVGIGILKGSVHLCAVDLNGSLLCSRELPLPFEDSEAFFAGLGQGFKAFLTDNQIAASSLLPVNAAVQGLPSADGKVITFGVLLHNQGQQADRLSAKLGIEVKWVHDSAAAAFYELHARPGLNNAVLFLLNRNFGGALIIGGQVVSGSGGWAGTLEHICLNPEGARCYCGSRGCAETVLSADALRQQAGLEIPEFFARLRAGNADCREVWSRYLNTLALLMRNTLPLVDGELILCGYLVPFMTEDDLDMLHALINANLPFDFARERLSAGSSGDLSPALGAALMSVDAYLKAEVLTSGSLQQI